MPRSRHLLSCSTAHTWRMLRPAGFRASTWPVAILKPASIYFCRLMTSQLRFSGACMYACTLPQHLCTILGLQLAMLVTLLSQIYPIYSRSCTHPCGQLLSACTCALTTAVAHLLGSHCIKMTRIFSHHAWQLQQACSSKQPSSEPWVGRQLAGLQTLAASASAAGWQCGLRQTPRRCHLHHTTQSCRSGEAESLYDSAMHHQETHSVKERVLSTRSCSYLAAART